MIATLVSSLLMMLLAVSLGWAQAFTIPGYTASDTPIIVGDDKPDCGPGQAHRRNSSGTDWECFTPLEKPDFDDLLDDLRMMTVNAPAARIKSACSLNDLVEQTRWRVTNSDGSVELVGGVKPDCGPGHVHLRNSFGTGSECFMPSEKPDFDDLRRMTVEARIKSACSLDDLVRQTRWLVEHSTHNYGEAPKAVLGAYPRAYQTCYIAKTDPPIISAYPDPNSPEYYECIPRDERKRLAKVEEYTQRRQGLLEMLERCDFSK